MYHLWVALRMKFQCFFSYIWSIIDINANCLRLAFCTCVMSVKTNNSGLFPHSCSTMSIVFKKWMLINRKQCIVSHVQKHRLPRHFYSPENPRLRLSRTWVPGLSGGHCISISVNLTHFNAIYCAFHSLWFVLSRERPQKNWSWSL